MARKDFEEQVKSAGALPTVAKKLAASIRVRKIPDIVDWINDNRIVNEKDQPIEFHNHKFMEALYRDWSPKIAVKKCSQIGGTVKEILRAAYTANERSMHIIYTLPTDKMLERFTPVKINPIIEHNQALKSMCRFSTTHLKGFGKGFIHLQGTNTETEAISTTSDWNIHDEYDRSRQDIIATFASRISASEYKWQSFFSNPSYPESGVDTYWRISDQKHWFIWCNHCGHPQFLTWPDSISNHDTVDGEHSYVCLKCGKTLSDEARRDGEWVAKYPGRTFSGYWISQLMCPWIPAEEIFLASRGKIKIKDTEGRLVTGKQVFYNFILGLEYAGSDDKVDRNVLMRNLVGQVNKKRTNVMGVDQGKFLNVIVGNKQGIYRADILEHFEQLDQIMDQEKIELCVIDAQPETRNAIEFAKRWPGKVFLCWYRDDPKGIKDIRWGDEGTKTPVYEVLVARNRVIDSCVEDFVGKKIPMCFRGDEGILQLYYKHWEAIYRIEDSDKWGNTRLVWDHTAPDHFVHATVYWRVAMSRISYFEEEDVEDTADYEIEMAKRAKEFDNKEEDFLDL